MELVILIGDTCLQFLPWVLGLGTGFALLTRLMPCNCGMHWGCDLRAAATDLLYMLVVPCFVRIAKTVILGVAIDSLFGGRAPGWSALAGLPLWLQCVLVLLLQDVMLYWIHRLFHTRGVWRFHAVHHSPKLLDWASSARNHLVNHLFSFVLVDVVVLLAGFRVEALVTLAPFTLVYSCMVHANLHWTFGPFRFLFASPVFHRWHHVSEGDAIDKNFASTFPVLDLLFGTFYMPVGVVPQVFGNGDPDYPEDFWGQLIAPFVVGRSRRDAEVVPPEAAAVGLPSLSDPRSA